MMLLVSGVNSIDYHAGNYAARIAPQGTATPWAQSDLHRVHLSIASIFQSPSASAWHAPSSRTQPKCTSMLSDGSRRSQFDLKHTSDAQDCGYRWLVRASQRMISR